MKNLLRKIDNMSFSELLTWELWILGFAGLITGILGLANIIK